MTLPVREGPRFFQDRGFPCLFSICFSAVNFVRAISKLQAIKDRLSQIGDIGDLSEVVPDMMETAADLFPTEAGTCSEISIGLDFVGKPAYLFPYE